MFRYVLFLIVLAGLGACTQDDNKTQAEACPINPPQGEQARAALSTAAGNSGSAIGSYAYQPIVTQQTEQRRPDMAPLSTPRFSAQVTVHNVNQRFREKLTDILEDDSEPKNIVVLSAGGQMGAFGAGFLNGIAQRAEGPLIPDLVTAVSAGSLLAVPVFLGREQDYETLRQEFTTITDDALITKRSAWRLPFSNSLYKTKKLRDRVRSIITEETINALTRAVNEENRRVAVMAVNLHSGLPVIFDLTAIAAGEDRYRGYSLEEKRTAIVSAIAASAAIEVIFEPIFIDDIMYGDGGARQYVFLGADLAVSADPARTQLSAPAAGLRTFSVSAASAAARANPVNLYVIVNEDFHIEPECTDNSLLGIAERTSSIVTDQILWSSVFELMTTSRQMGWRTQITDARTVVMGSTSVSEQCTPTKDSDAFFDRPFMRCLYQEACKYAAVSNNPWREGLNAMPPSALIAADGTDRPGPDYPSQCTPWPLP